MYGQIQPNLLLGQRRDLTLSTEQTSVIFNTSVPLEVDITLTDHVSKGYDFDNDYVNNGTPYLDIVYNIVYGAKDALQTESIPLGTLVTYGNEETQYSKSSQGQVIFFLDRANETGDSKYVYNMREIFDSYPITIEGGETETTNVGLKLDFSQAIGADFDSENEYYLQVCLYRTDEPGYPTGSTPVSTLLIPLVYDVNVDYGMRVDVPEKELNWNISSDDELSFEMLFSGIAAGSETAQISYTVEKRGDDGKYTALTDEELARFKLMMNHGSAEGEKQLTFAGGVASIEPWYYRSYDEDEYTITATITKDNVATDYATVKVTLDGSGSKIGSVSVEKVEGSDYVSTDEITAIVGSIVANNGTRYAESLATSEGGKSIVNAVKAILANVRVMPSTSETGGTNTTYVSGMVLKVGEGSESIFLGNYRITAELIVNGVTVASDFFICNINRNQEHPTIQGQS